MLTLHIANKNYSSWSLRPWVLLRMRDIAFSEALTPFEPTGNRERFRRFSPNGKVPCLVDGGIAVWDSLAIVEYLAERHPGIWPAGAQARAWARCAAAEMHSGFTALREHCSMCCAIRVRLREQPTALQQDLDRLAELWHDGLARFGGPFLAGAEFTAVDAFFAPVAFRIQTYGLALDAAAGAYAARLLALAPMRQWAAEAAAETWRDAGHDEAIGLAGTVIEDFRAPAA